MAPDLCHILEDESGDVCFWDWDEKPWKTLILNPKNMAALEDFQIQLRDILKVRAVNFQGCRCQSCLGSQTFSPDGRCRAKLRLLLTVLVEKNQLVQCISSL